MTAIKRFLKTTLIGGVIILLPIGILMGVFKWFFGLIKGWVAPLTAKVMAHSEMKEILAIAIVLLLLFAVCFLIGAIVRMQWGRFLHEKLEKRILKIAPGYNLIKETVMQFLGNRPSPFSSVCVAQIFGNDTLVTAFVTERHDNGLFSVFVPTGPNPTSGNIYHLRSEFVHPVDLPVESVMRSIISCGAGSDAVIKSYLENKNAPE
jgi:uncharacterized membrane protein